MARHKASSDMDSAIDSWLACVGCNSKHDPPSPPQDALRVAGGLSGGVSPSAESPSLSPSSYLVDREQEVDTHQTMYQRQLPPRHEVDASTLWAHHEQTAHGHHGGPWGGILSHLESITSTLEPLFPASSPEALPKHADSHWGYFNPPGDEEQNGHQGEQQITTLLSPALSSDSVGHHQHTTPPHPHPPTDNTNCNCNSTHRQHLSFHPRPSHKTHSHGHHRGDDDNCATASATAAAISNDSTNSLHSDSRWYDNEEKEVFAGRRALHPHTTFGSSSYGESTPQRAASPPERDFASFRRLLLAAPPPHDVRMDCVGASAPIGAPPPSPGTRGIAVEGVSSSSSSSSSSSYYYARPTSGKEDDRRLHRHQQTSLGDPGTSGGSPSYDGDFVRGTTDWLALSEALRKNGLPALTFVTGPTQSLGIPNPAHERMLFRAFEEALVQLNRRALLLDQLIEANKRAEARMGRYKDEATHLRSKRDKLRHCWQETESAMETIQQQFLRKHNEQLEDFFKLRKEHDHALQTIKEQERALHAKDLEIAALQRQLGGAS